MNYKYDVFISYRREDPVRGWVQNHFHPLFEGWFKESFPPDWKPKVYIDRKLETGAQWADELRDALLHSRCILCVWSPTYFGQNWCLTEWLSMLKREESLKGQSDARPRLVYPVKFNDGKNFPERARSAQHFDLSPYNTAAYRETALYDDFKKQIQIVAEEVAEMAIKAPAWQAGWPLVDADDAPAVLHPTVPLKRL